MAGTHQFLTPEAIGNFATAVVAVVAVSRVARYLCQSEQPAITFFIALIIAYLGAGAAGALAPIPWRDLPHQTFFLAVLGWILPSVNACLLFVTAMGASQVV